jgi:hypothetical protein
MGLIRALTNAGLDSLTNLIESVLSPTVSEEEHAKTQKILGLYKNKEDLTKEEVLRIARENGVIGNSKIEEFQFIHNTHKVKENLDGITGYYFLKLGNETYTLTHAGGMDF